MKTETFFLFAALLVVGVAHAQDATNAPAANASHVVEVPQPLQPAEAAAAKNLSDAQIAAYQKRFDEGYALQQAGKIQDALKIYDGILAEQPDAKRSLLEAGRISFQLGDLPKAEACLEKLHQIVPDFPEAIELLIQINQALGRDVRVELLVRDFTDLRNSGKIPELQQSLCFVRERVPYHDQTIVVSQFFDYTADPNTVWMGEVYDATGKLQQRILLNYDNDATRALRAKDDKYAHTQVFTWFGHEIKDGRVTTLNAYLQIFALPDYNKFRSAMLVILGNPPKPIYSAPVPAGAGQ
ncbi:MAG TPA: tetratricopeptide repeat protein [Candidatus Methylacidiphilales bacterium]|jgi:tetratricopeptide (TPR) repeat protein|nr:tetratricopeptide repeat protein [Candidatus Methylacidiphilales bacterium]